MKAFIETLINGLSLGSVYALIALGYTMVYGILKFINFAHANVFMIGAWLSYILASKSGFVNPEDPNLLAIPFVLLGSMLICGVLGVMIEKLAYAPLRKAERLNILITAIGVSLLLENGLQLDFLFGTQPVGMPVLLENSVVATVAGAKVFLVDVLGISIALVLMTSLHTLVFHTQMGSAMRAVANSPQNAALMGISAGRIIGMTFFLGSALAAAAGFFYGMKYSGLQSPGNTTWVLLGIKAFVAAVVGGIGNINGAVLGGFLIGLIEMFGVAYLRPEYKDVYVFAILIVVLLVKPTGILGKPELEKV
ncbi:MAG: branched-chain amino acid ABC transporter permease [Candidatus Sumerlaeia bacterium]|nr:branched-chain amino acid ABC transporter permease [Candidatus Sumerlaeia bacterium]